MEDENALASAASGKFKLQELKLDRYMKLDKVEEEEGGCQSPEPSSSSNHFTRAYFKAELVQPQDGNRNMSVYTLLNKCKVSSFWTASLPFHPSYPSLSPSISHSPSPSPNSQSSPTFIADAHRLQTSPTMDQAGLSALGRVPMCSLAMAQPLLDPQEIETRLDLVETFVNDVQVKDERRRKSKLPLTVENSFDSPCKRSICIPSMRQASHKSQEHQLKGRQALEDCETSKEMLVKEKMINPLRALEDDFKQDNAQGRESPSRKERVLHSLRDEEGWSQVHQHRVAATV
eukprot:761602-Hanusia_phi.AAC.2